jgi:glycosyltransferase involved in cell wall biosynthesis
MRGSAAPFYLLYQTGLAPTNGTSVQLVRLLEGIEDSAVHLLWDIREAGATSVSQSLVLDDTYEQAPAKDADNDSSINTGQKWWSGADLNERRLQEALQRFPSKPTRAWVFCGNERDAARATTILQALDDPPFLLHIMDLFHNRISAAHTPRFLALIQAANQVVCTSAAAAAEARRHRSGETHVLPCCSNFTATGRCSWDKQRFRIAVTGALWEQSMWNESPALETFAAAWPTIKERLPGVELHYAGAFGTHLPSSLAADVHDHGYLEPRQCERLLHDCHLAYLAVSLNTRFGPYSVPSRLADYLACGLPTVTCTSPGTGIFSFINQIPPAAVTNVANADELADVITSLANNPLQWKSASADAAKYAEQALHADHIRSKLLEYLDRCEVRPAGDAAAARSST